MCWEVLPALSGFSDTGEPQRDSIPAPAPSAPPSVIIIWLTKPLVLELDVHIYLDRRCVNSAKTSRSIGAKDINNYNFITISFLVAKSYPQRKFVMPCLKKLIYRDIDHLHFRCFDPFILKSKASDVEQWKLKYTSSRDEFQKNSHI